MSIFVDKLKGLSVLFNSWIIQRVTIFLFITSATILFYLLNNVQRNYYIDEAFHIPQTQKYCSGNFFEWDKKITTLPGLYLLSAGLLAPLKQCNTISLRGINLILTILNLYVTYKIVKGKSWSKNIKQSSSWLPLAVAFSIALLPPLFFWFFLYYTDVLSTNLVLLMFLLHQNEFYKSSAIIGGLSILVRQTNIIWIFMIAGERAISLIELQTPRSIETLVSRGMHTGPQHAKLVWANVMHHVKQGKVVRFFIEMIKDLSCHVAVAIAFILFVIFNKGIVVGDRNAHTPVIHLPQLFYFSVFFGSFAWPYVLPNWKNYFTIIKKHWIIASSLFALMTIIVHNNTLVHPYVLADNRHYVFYIWNKIMGRYLLVKYLLIPIYGFFMYSLFVLLKNLKFLTKLFIIFCICVVLVPQLLLEPRYFVIPYIIVRLNMPQPKLWQIIAELMTCLIVNFLQFYIFVTKTFYWTDGEGPQRISW
ncbi:hypothetical protein HCN44_008376 [Aphidius gifuensis]|uniref:Dol-P-Glc:Glc(2)Man(9)GlcNAc(2)-PP-Dol alpha-1,2-glucosyltransferase n=1 Tax=Aphidius gifuensis TaxID=684658 RepID=A0A835CMY3_APHGI|nr:putative Dol-P-Glc:Glc(2)Man(9)GlcNAc(2)-PP-Dol alpha-1,2-glucosyltransferase [Aphidius gifuensis]KAF7989702.1 hypothetical protein HCN44_008376 [Aphidius gifuensis]